MMRGGPAFECDLHTHTTRSDGNDSCEELIEGAAAAGLKAVAITDHDMAPPEWMDDGGSPVSPAEFGRRRGIVVLGGAEYSCDTDVDDVHIVALGCDWSSAGLRREAERMRHSKSDAYRRLVGKLASRGIGLSWDEILENSGSPIRDEDVQRKHLFEAIARKGFAATWREAKLLVRGDPGLDVRREKTAAAEAIRLVHEAGGIAILAHPYLIDPELRGPGGTRITRERYINALIDSGLDGIEASYPYDKTSYGGTMRPEEIEREVLSLYGKRLAVISGGSDYHADWKKRIPNPRSLGEKGVAWDYLRDNVALSKLAGLARKMGAVVFRTLRGPGRGASLTCN